MFKNLSLVSGIIVILMVMSCERNINIPIDASLTSETEHTNQVEQGPFVTMEKALNTADLFMGSNGAVANTRSTVTESPGPSTVHTMEKDGKPMMYVVNYDKGGFAIISATRDYMPILAYSEDGYFDVSSIQGGLSLWVDETMTAVEASGEQADSVKTAMNRLWRVYEEDDAKSAISAIPTRSTSSTGYDAYIERCEELMNEYWDDGWNFTSLDNARYVFEDAGFLDVYEQLCYSAEFNNSEPSNSIVGWKMGSSTESYGPMLQTQWHQDTPFNNLCGGYSAGCGAIAFAQVMKYHEYPQQITYNGYPFTWSSIPNNPSSSSDQSKLIKAIGVTTNMRYWSVGSWTTPDELEEGIEAFGYTVTRQNNNNNSVEREILRNHRPVIMLGNNTNLSILPGSAEYIGNSHYWVADGARRTESNVFMVFAEWQPNDCGEFTQSYYSIDDPLIISGTSSLFYYYNWGWGGVDDGWYAFNSNHYPYSRQNFLISKP